MALQKTVQPFGLWPSPISALTLGQMVRLENPQFNRSGATLLWMEGRSGRNVLVAKPGGAARLDLTVEQAVGGGVGYGGGDYHILDDLLVFAEKNGRLYRRRLGFDSPRPLTPPFGMAASPAISPDGRWVAYVWSDGKTDLLGLVDAEGRDWPVQLARGATFYMQPAWHPASDRLAWVEWDHPNMPWDGAHLMLGRLAGFSEIPHLAEVQHLAGDAHTAVSQPQFSPDGRWLSCVVGNGEFEDLVLFDLESGQSRVWVNGDAFHLCLPAWSQGERSHGWSFDSQRVFYLRNSAGRVSLWSVELASGRSEPIDTAPYTWLESLSVSPTTTELTFVGSAPAISPHIVRWDGRSLHVEARSTGETLAPEYFSQPQAISWPAPDGTPVHGLYYPPANPHFQGQGLPPAILRIHGGPTSAAVAAFSAETAYYTSRGYAVLQVNYRGSTGYGRAYRDALLGRWGEVDSEDAAGGARALVELGLADPGRLIIQGGSAGGFTVLNALIQYPGLFKAGVCLFGVSNLFNLDTHKFEERYNDSLVGPLPAAAQKYHAWSPVFHAAAIRDALAVFQGAEDQVVPPVHSEEIVAGLRRSGTAHIYKLYPGEGHGFRKSETIVDYLGETERFLQTHVLFAP
jgi:dipeptidyl aminopeptidase/acylaminoacyl peptidase